MLVAARETRQRNAGAMTTAYESATDWNRTHPPGSLVRIVLRDGTASETRTRSYAQQWGAFAVVALQDHAGLFTVSALQPVIGSQ